ncbi:MAG: hypothetical protein DRG87_11965 [Deltaproteobacteria bacterium]|nr:MAG: hypothetical protein DRG87_11965 [Deltaproteobacteria bacterium]
MISTHQPRGDLSKTKEADAKPDGLYGQRKRGSPLITSNELAGKVLLCLQREEPPDYESTNGIEGAWVFNRKPARA